MPPVHQHRGHLYVGAVSCSVYTSFGLPFNIKVYILDFKIFMDTACAAPGTKIYEVATRFSVSRSFANKPLRRHRTSGSLAGWQRSGLGIECA